MVATPFKGIPETCTHERRAGTTVCLHCRHAALEATRERRQQLFLRGSAMFVGVLVFAGAGVMGASALRERGASGNQQPRHLVKTAAAAAAPKTQSEFVAENSSEPVAQQPAAKQQGVPRPPLTSIVPMGNSALPNGVTAIRTDSDVTVSFDLMMVRTRRPEKFEYFLRQTLPLIYGADAKTALAKIPTGGLASQGDLLTQLPARGVHIPLDSGWTLEVFPQTRPGQDGPLVVRYRAKLVQ